MWLLILEALTALALLLFIVWWTMFSGRRPEPKAGDEERGDARGEGREIDRPIERDNEQPPPR